MRLGVSLAVLVTLGWVLTGQAARQTHKPTHLVTDWSHRHLVFSQPRNAEEARRLAEDPRYDQQFNRQAARHLMQVPMPEAVRNSFASGELQRPGHVHHPKLHRDWSEDLGSGGTLPANYFPAKYSFDVNTASCATDPNPDFAVFSTGLLSSGTQASIVAYDNLYFGCTGTRPQVYWAYDTGGQILTSPVFSEDGTQLAFVETNGGLGIFVLLKWAASATASVTAPGPITTVLPGAYHACIAPCMTQIILADQSNVPTDDTTSSIFYDYKNNFAWVGGARGWLHKILSVFSGGPPTELKNAKWPLQVSNSLWLSSPVYDRRSVNVFVGDSGGLFYSIDATSGAIQSTAQLDFGTGITDSPVVDTNGQLAYVFASNDGSTNCAGGPCAAVYNLSTTQFVTGGPVGKVTVGASSATPSPLYSGAFDSNYYASQNGTGNLYVCGNTGGPPAIYQVPINAGVFGTSTAIGGSLSIGTTGCSPVSDIVNPGTLNPGGPPPVEWIFSGTQAGGTPGACGGGGCVISMMIQAWKPDNLYPLNTAVLDSNFNIQVVTNILGGRSGDNPPTWNMATKGDTTDGNGVATAVVWQNQGPLSVLSQPLWQGSTLYNLGDIVIDSNNNYEYCNNSGGTSGLTPPTWDTRTGKNTADNTVHWINLGPNPTSALPASGGSTGIIMDNVVSNGTLTGASQVYFSTLGSQVCGTSGTGNCAIQASQPGLN